MLIQILLGLGIIILSIGLQAIFIELVVRFLRQRFGSTHPAKVGFSKFVFTLSGITLWLLICLLLIVTIWAFLFVWVGVFVTLEESFYFSLVAFTTLGFGDVTIPIEWRVLSGFIATNGFLLFGLNTAVLMEVMIRMRSDNHG